MATYKEKLAEKAQDYKTKLTEKGQAYKERAKAKVYQYKDYETKELERRRQVRLANKTTVGQKLTAVGRASRGIIQKSGERFDKRRFTQSIGRPYRQPLQKTYHRPTSYFNQNIWRKPVSYFGVNALGQPIRPIRPVFIKPRKRKKKVKRRVKR